MSDIDPTLNEHYCFGCGRHNPIGLHLTFERGPDGDMVAHYRPRAEDQGFPQMMHGGIATVLLDEAMGWSMYADRVFAVTARMEVRFRHPIPVAATDNAPLVVRSRIVRHRGRRIELEADLCAADGTRLVEATGLFLRMDPDAEAAALATFEATARASDAEATGQ